MTDLLSKLLINLIIFIFIANCKDFKSGKSNQNSSVNSAIVNVANCASVTDLSQCAIAITQDKTICEIGRAHV